jgi:hypothetical protein
MGTRIELYTKELVPAVKDFNTRLKAGGCQPDFLFPESEISSWLPKLDGRPVYEEMYVALESAVVRGAYILKLQEFSFRDCVVPIGYYHGPISEGIIAKAYSMVGVELLMDALRRAPRLFALGMGSEEEPLPRLLKAMRWNLHPVPFYFQVVHPAAFLRNIQPLRRTPARRLALDVLAWSGVGWLGLKTLNFATRPKARSTPVEMAPEFGAWADELWERGQAGYAMAAVRDSRTLNILYPRDDTRFIRLRVGGPDRTAGWAVALNTRMSGDKYFGDMRLGSIIDCWAQPADAAAVVRAAASVLRELGADLIVTNQSHCAWCAACEAAGFRCGPSNFIFAASEKLTDLIGPFDDNKALVHLTRGDGDGPIHL